MLGTDLVRVLLHDIHIRQEQNHTQNQLSVLESVGSAIGELFDFQSVGTYYDSDEAEFKRQHNPKRKKQKQHSSK